MKRRIVSLLIVFSFAFTMIPAMNMTAFANNGVATKLDTLRSKFPAGQFWNHYVASSADIVGYMVNNPYYERFSDTVTSNPCTTHHGNGTYDCNNFDGGIQCCGFAKKIFYELFGERESSNSLICRYDKNIQVGDFVKFTFEHYAVVLSVSGNSFTVVECNLEAAGSQYNCMIRWGGSYSKSQIAYYVHANSYDDVNATYSTHYHTWSYGNDSGHPHAQYRVCGCGAREYTGARETVWNCQQCYPLGGVSFTRSFERTGGTATFYRNDVSNANSYTLTVYKNGSVYQTVNMAWSSFTLNNLTGADYYATLTVKNTNTGETKNINCDTFHIVDTYPVTFDANEGINAPASQKKIQNEDLTLTTAIPTRPHYIFKGWAASKNAIEPQYQPGDKYTKDTKITLYAVWEPEKYTISFDANGGKGEISDTVITYGDALKMPNNVLKEYFYLLGWSKNQKAEKPDYKLGLQFKLEENTKLYAVWGKASWSGAIAKSFAGGDGTQKNPYQISNASELAYLAQQVNNQLTEPKYKYYILTDNINLGYENWVPIGLHEYDTQYFYGSFDGNGYSISDLYVNDAYSGYTGLFGYAKDSMIKNVTIAGDMEYIKADNTINTGALTGYAENTEFENCNASYVNISQIKAEANDFSSVGCIIGMMKDSKAINCTARDCYIDMSNGNFRGGIIVGSAVDSDVVNCNVTSEEELLGTNSGKIQAGGLVGYIKGNAKQCTVKSAFLSNNVKTESGVSLGGIAGYTDGEITLCTVDFKNGKSKIIDGGMYNISIGATGILTSSVGGITGELSAKASIKNCKYDGESISVASDENAYAGGIAGKSSIGFDFNKCLVNVDGIIYNSALNNAYAGGLVGFNDNTISEYNGNTYMVIDKVMTWNEAKEYCKSLGGHLVTITSEGEQDAIVSLLEGGKMDYYWIGATDEETEGTWKWVTGEPWNYTNWNVKEPNNYDNDGDGNGENYVQIFNKWDIGVSKGVWNDSTDNGIGIKTGIICEFESSNENPTTYFKGNKYELIDIGMTWKEAKLYCENLGGHLATITSQDEEATIELLLDKKTKENYWLGATDEDIEGRWQWVTGEPFVYSNWAEGEPTNQSGASGGKENYLEFWGSRKWNDIDNTRDNQAKETSGFICEYEDVEYENPTVLYKNNKYVLYDEGMSWKDAKEYCEKLGGHLVTITSKEEQYKINQLLNQGEKYNYWIGATDEASEGIWKWITGENSFYSNWNLGEPNNVKHSDGNENYAAIYNAKIGATYDYRVWNDMSNTEFDDGGCGLTGFICEYEDAVSNPANIGINIGDYVQMGTYDGEPILWRCVDIDENGPLMLSDKILCIKSFDAGGTYTDGISSHGSGRNGGESRKTYGSSFWGDSTIRSWLNSSESEGNVHWLCGNPPSIGHVSVTENTYDKEAGFLNGFTTKEKKAIKYAYLRNLADAYEQTPYEASKNYHLYESNIQNVMQNYDTADFAACDNDKVFLLDVKQIKAVYDNGDILGSDYYIGVPTKKAVEKSPKISADDGYTLKEGEKWLSMLRTPSNQPYSSSISYRIVKNNGIVEFAYANNGKIGVRPAFYLNLDETDFATGSGTVQLPYKISDSVSTADTLTIADRISSISDEASCFARAGDVSGMNETDTVNVSDTYRYSSTELSAVNSKNKTNAIVNDEESTHKPMQQIKLASFLNTVFGPDTYQSLDYLKDHPDAVWVVKDGELPELYYNVLNDIKISDDIENGSISVDKEQAIDGEVVAVTAVPDNGYVLNKIYANGEEVVGTSFEVSGDTDVYATFAKEIPKYSVKVQGSDNAEISVTNVDEVGLMALASADDLSAYEGQEIEVSTTADKDYSVEAVYVNGEEIAGNSFIIADNSNITLSVSNISTEIKATTNDVSEAGTHYAIVSGSVDGNGNGITKYVRYWEKMNPNEVYTTESEEGTGDFAVALYPLKANTTYCCQVTENGEVKEFTTLEEVQQEEPTVKSITSTKFSTLSEKFKFSVSCNTALDNAKIIVAIYNADKVLLATESVECDGDDSYDIKTPIYADAEYAKIYVWDSMDNMKPLGAAETVSTK